MNNQPSLFPLDDYHQNPKNDNISFYVEVEIKGEWFFVWKPHQEFDQLEKLEEKGDTRKRPFRWLTAAGATAYAINNYTNWRVKNYVESEWKSD